MKKTIRFTFNPFCKPEIRKVKLPRSSNPMRKHDFMFTGVEFNRLYHFFKGVFEKESPGHSEQLSHAYALGQIEIIGEARFSKQEKDRLISECLKLFEQESNYGGW